MHVYLTDIEMEKLLAVDQTTLILPERRAERKRRRFERNTGGISQMNETYIPVPQRRKQQRRRKYIDSKA